MRTSFCAIGTNPGFQFPAVFQTVPFPFHVRRLVTVITKLCAGRMLTLGGVLLPLSCIWTVTVAEPRTLAGVYVSTPVGLIAGWPVNRALLSFVTTKLSVWPDSFAGPAESA